MKGDPSAGPKVLKSTQEDSVLLYLVGNGAPGLVEIGKEYLFAEELKETIQFMRENQMYEKMVIYAESPESGSMFAGMGYEDLRVYGVSSSDS